MGLRSVLQNKLNKYHSDIITVRARHCNELPLSYNTKLKYLTLQIQIYIKKSADINTSDEFFDLYLKFLIKVVKVKPFRQRLRTFLIIKNTVQDLNAQ